MKGRPRKPAEVKLIQGTFRKHREPEQPPDVEPAENIDPPRHLDGLALQTWQWAAPLLRDARILSNSDMRALECYCLAYQTMRTAHADLEDRGNVLERETGVPLKNPSATVWKDAMAELRYYSAILGLDPASRGRLNVAKQKPQGNPFLDL